MDPLRLMHRKQISSLNMPSICVITLGHRKSISRVVFDLFTEISNNIKCLEYDAILICLGLENYIEIMYLTSSDASILHCIFCFKNKGNINVGKSLLYSIQILKFYTLVMSCSVSTDICVKPFRTRTARFSSRV